MFKEIKKENLSKIIIRNIHEHIIVNNLKPGDKLPTEQVLAEKFKVGRSSVREALKTLENIGLVCGKPRIGTVLSSEDNNTFILPLVFGLVLESIEISHLNEFRIVIELGICRIAVKNATDEELDKLIKLAIELDNNQIEAVAKPSKAKMTKVASLDKKFHSYLIELSHNPILIKFNRFWGIYFSRVRDSGELFQASKINVQNKINHAKIVEAIKERDEEKAVTAMKNHLIYWIGKKEDISKSILIDLIKNH